MDRDLKVSFSTEITCVETSYIDADWREADRRRDLMSEQLGRCVPGISVD